MTNEATPQSDSGDASAPLVAVRTSVRWMTGGVVAALIGMAIHLIACLIDIQYLRSWADEFSDHLAVRLHFSIAVVTIFVLLTLLPNIITRAAAFVGCAVLTALWAPASLMGAVFALLGNHGASGADAFEIWQITAILACMVPLVGIGMATMGLSFELYASFMQRRFRAA